MKIVNYVLSMLSQASTWKGITSLLTAVGVAIDPTQAAAIVAAGLAIVGAIQVFVDGHDEAKADVAVKQALKDAE